jgi:hypothetical protein
MRCRSEMGRILGISSLVSLVWLAGCGGGEGDADVSQVQGSGGSEAAGAGGSSAGSGQAGGSGGAQAGNAGSSQAGSGGSGQAGGNAAGQAGDAGSGQAGSGGSGQAGDAGSGQAGDAGSGQAGDAGSGQAGDAGSGQAGDAGSGQAGDAGSGQGGDAGSGQGGDGGAPGGCCKEDKDCAGPDPVVLVCVGGQCKLPAGPGQCWEDADCGVNAACEGEFICPCGALCGPQADTAGKCVPVVGPGCCKADEECQKQGLDQCVEGVCRAKLPDGQCWDGADCADTQLCQGAAPCPCGLLCGQDSPGKCVDGGPTPGCCKVDKDCGDKGQCVLPGGVGASEGGVCKPLVTDGSCWDNGDCKPGQSCEGEQVCPCGANCLLPDVVGKCK